MECASHYNPLLGWVVGLSLEVNLVSSFCAIVEVQSKRWNVNRISPLSERWEPQVHYRLTLNITYQGRRQRCPLLFARFQNVDNTERLACQQTSPPQPTILHIMQPVLSSFSFSIPSWRYSMLILFWRQRHQLSTLISPDYALGLMLSPAPKLLNAPFWPSQHYLLTPPLCLFGPNFYHLLLTCELLVLRPWVENENFALDAWCEIISVSPRFFLMPSWQVNKY